MQPLRFMSDFGGIIGAAPQKEATLTPTKTPSAAPLQGGGIISEWGGGIISEQGGGISRESARKTKTAIELARVGSHSEVYG
jgi:hypothetical protein